jgi:hypothetical protein
MASSNSDLEHVIIKNFGLGVLFLPLLKTS